MDEHVETYLFVFLQIMNHIAAESILGRFSHAQLSEKISVNIKSLH
jgi:hypothetical protein